MPDRKFNLNAILEFISLEDRRISGDLDQDFKIVRSFEEVTTCSWFN